MVGVGSIIAEL